MEIAGWLAGCARMLASVSTPADRTTTVLLAGEDASPRNRRWLLRRMHLLVRGGAPTLWREALATDWLRPYAQDKLRAPDAPRLCAWPLASTRTDTDARFFTLATGLREILDAAFVGPSDQIVVLGEGSALQSRLLRWSAAGGPWGDDPAGWLEIVDPFLEPAVEAAFAASPDGAVVAVSGVDPDTDQDLITVLDLPALDLRARLPGGRGPMRYLDPQRLAYTDGDGLRLHPPLPGSGTSAVPTAGAGDLAVTPDGRYLLVPARWGPGFVVHELPSLRLRAIIGDDANELGWARCATTVAVGPSGTYAVTGARDGVLRRWDLAGILDRIDITPLIPLDAPAPQWPTVTACPVALGAHRAEISRARCVDESTVVSGGRDGVVMAWDVAAGSGRLLGRHLGYVVTVAVGRNPRRVLSAGEDGTVVRWDLSAPDGAPSVSPFWPDPDRAVLLPGDPGTVVVRADTRITTWSAKCELIGDRTVARQEADQHAARSLPDDASPVAYAPGQPLPVPGVGTVEIGPQSWSVIGVRDLDRTRRDDIHLGAPVRGIAVLDGATLLVLDAHGDLHSWHIQPPPRL